MAKYYHRKIKNFLVMVFFAFYFLGVIFAEQKIKKISSNLTEFDRNQNIVKFFGNVKVELENGYILCDKAEYNEKTGEIFCESNVYVVMISTIENYYINIKSHFVKYNLNDKILKFNNNVYTKYKNLSEKENTLNEVEIKCNILYLQQKEKNIWCKENVEIFTKEDKILCSSVRYIYEDGVMFINEDLQTEEHIKFISLNKDLKLKSCTAKKAIVNIKDNKISLKGQTEVVFYQ